MSLARGEFIVSLDCEGKWGMADVITPHHDRHITRANLINAYRDLAAMFSRYEIPATFAFVMVFLLDDTGRAEFADRILDVEVQGANWLHHFRAAERSGNVDGWFCPEALEIVAAHPEHEVACHGFCHLPLDEDLISLDTAERELQSCRTVARSKGLELETFVFPRNHLGYFEVIAAAGFTGFRGRSPGYRRDSVGRLTSLAAEFNTMARAQDPNGTKAGMHIIPSGAFLNWQRGVRRSVPRSVSRSRWKSILRDAADNRRVAHVWLHPHNLIDGPGTLERLDDVLIEAAKLRDQGRLDILTQAEYVRRRAGRAAPALEAR
jgi:hypothetical protein